MKKLFNLEPNKDLLVVLALWIFVSATFYTAFIVFTTELVALNFITFGVIGISIIGIGLPVTWHAYIKKRPFKEIGITTDKLSLSIILSIIFTFLQYVFTIKKINIPEFNIIFPLITMVISVGIFENIFFRGFIQLRMEYSFGVIPGILISSIMYSLYHIGYGMKFDEMVLLFIIGLIYSTIFKLTDNIFILFPLLTPLGAIYTHIKNELVLPIEASIGFILVQILILFILFFVYKNTKLLYIGEVI